MKKRQAYFASISVLLMLAVVSYWKFNRSQALHVFINETSDHRFDESIQVSILAAFNRTKVQNAVIITDRFSQADFVKEASRLFQELQLGRKTKGRAILYLYSPKEHSLKIEVGYALEGILPDIQVYGFEAAAKTFIFADRFQDFWAELINTINIEIHEQESGTKAQNARFDFSTFRFVSGGAGIMSTRYANTVEQLKEEMKILQGSRASEYAPDSDARVTLELYLKSLSLGIGDPKLPLLTPESRLFREFTPLTNYQQYRNWKMIQSAGLGEVLCEGDVCFAFWKDGHPVLPVVLRRLSGHWYVDEPMSWSLFHRFEDSMRVYLKFPIRFKSQELQKYITTHLGRPLYDQPVVDFENVGRNSTEEGSIEYLFFKLFWLERVDAALMASPNLKVDQDLLWIALDTYTNLGRFSKVLEVLRVLVGLNPNDLALKERLRFYEKTFDFKSAIWRVSF